MTIEVNTETITIAVAAFVGLGALISFSNIFSLWIRCRLGGCPVSYSALIAIRLRRSPLEKLIESQIRLKTNGIEIPLTELEIEYIKAPDDFDTFVNMLIQENNQPTSRATQ